MEWSATAPDGRLRDRLRPVRSFADATASRTVQSKRVITGWREHRTDMLRWFWRRPLLAIGLEAFEAAESLSKKVDGRLKLLAECRVASLVGCEFCLDLGAALAAASGLTERKLLELHDFETSDAFDDDERLVLRYAATLSTTPAVVAPELRAMLVDCFGTAGLTELTAAIAHEHERTLLNVGLGVRPGRSAPDDACRIAAAPPPAASVGLPA